MRAPHHDSPLQHLWHIGRYSVADQLRFAWQSRRVWWFTATARTRARFTRTKLGSLWLGLTNLLSIAALASVYGTVFKVERFDDYVVYLGIGLVLWNSLSSAIGSAPTLLEQNRDSIINLNLPPVFYPLQEWAFQVQTFAQSFLLVLMALTWYNHKLFFNLILVALPGLLNFFIAMFWLPLLVCLLGARFKDLYQLVPVVLQLVFLLSPIMYWRESLGAMAWIASLNPLYQAFAPLRDALIYGEGHPVRQLVLLFMNLIGLVASLKLLQRDSGILPFLV